MNEPDILLLNANTDQALTERMVTAAQRLHQGCRGETVATGAPYISDEPTARLAAEAVLSFGEGLTETTCPDALVVACFGDPGVGELRARLSVPVLGMAEASCHAACQLGRRFGIVTGGANWVPMLDRLVERIGLKSRLSGIHALDLTGDRIAANREAARAEVQGKVAEAHAHGADIVILGGAGLVGFASELQGEAAVRLLDSLQCAVTQALAMALLASATSLER